MSVFSLKLIALISMVIDHTGAVLFPHEMWFRYVGRLAFPIYCFLLTEGFMHTGDMRKYSIRLLVFSFVSEVPFDLALHGKLFYPKSQNVFITLFLGLVMLNIIKWSGFYISVISVISIMYIAQLIHCDYRYPGILMILMFYCFKDLPILGALNVSGVNFRMFDSRIQAAGALSLLPISLYNGKKGKGLKWLFYAFYPGHLLLLYLIKLIVTGQLSIIS